MVFDKLNINSIGVNNLLVIVYKYVGLLNKEIVWGWLILSIIV